MLVACAKQDTIPLDDNLSEDIYVVKDRSFFTDNTIINDEIVSFHNPLDFFHHSDFVERSFAPTVLKSFNTIDNKSVIVDNDVSSLCNRGDIEKCSSFREYLSTGLIRSENKLFFMTDLIIDKFSSKTIIAMSDLDGSNMEIIYSLPSKETTIYGYVYLNSKLYFSSSDDGLIVYDLASKKHDVVLEHDENSSTFYNLSVESNNDEETLTFNATKYTDESGKVYQNAFIMLIDGELILIREHANMDMMFSDYKDFSITYNEASNEIKMEFDNGEKVILENDFNNGRFGQADLIGNGYLILNYYSTKNDNVGGKIALYQIDGNEVVKIDEIIHDVEFLSLNFIYKNIIVFGRLWSDDQFGDMIHPSYILMNSEGLSEIFHIDENE